MQKIMVNLHIYAKTNLKRGSEISDHIQRELFGVENGDSGEFLGLCLDGWVEKTYRSRTIVEFLFEREATLARKHIYRYMFEHIRIAPFPSRLRFLLHAVCSLFLYPALPPAAKPSLIFLLKLSRCERKRGCTEGTKSLFLSTSLSLVHSSETPPLVSPVKRIPNALSAVINRGPQSRRSIIS